MALNLQKDCGHKLAGEVEISVEKLWSYFYGAYY